MGERIVILGVTGSRDWTSREIVARAFDEAAADFTIDHVLDPVIVIEGGAAGADAICRIEATVRGWHVATVRAIWGLYGPRQAGHIRNNAMVYLGANAYRWLAFINPCIKKDCPVPKPHDSHGTTQCLLAAKAVQIDAREYRNG